MVSGAIVNPLQANLNARNTLRGSSAKASDTCLMIRPFRSGGR
jgi:hypothetical protein